MSGFYRSPLALIAGLASMMAPPPGAGSVNVPAIHSPIEPPSGGPRPPRSKYRSGVPRGLRRRMTKKLYRRLHAAKMLPHIP